MADIFLSYARADRDKIEKIAAALEADGRSVWWDRHIAGGAEFSKDIERELGEAKAVIVAWSAAASDSRWVKDEAGIAARAGKLVTLSLDGTEPPIGFRQFHAIDYAKGDDAAFAELKRSLEGKLTGAPTAAAPATTPQRPRLAALVAAGALVVLISSLLPVARFFLTPPGARQVGSGEVAATKSQPQEEPPASADGVTSDSRVGLAVLPFANFSTDPEQEFFADGLTEEILNWLGNVEGLRVPGRTTSFQFKGKAQDLRAIGDALNVGYILEGSVRRSADTLRITAQLIDATTGDHIWSETYDRTLADIFAIQDEIARNVVTELLGKIPETGIENPAAVGDVDPRAHELYLEGRALLSVRQWEASFSKFRAAAAADGRHVLAHAYIAVIAAWAQANAFPLPDIEKSLTATADEALAAAVRLRPDAADVLFAQGWVSDARSTRFAAAASPDAIDFYQRAVRANPRHVEALHALARAEMAIDSQRSIEFYERVLAIDAGHSSARNNLIDAYLASGERDKALLAARQSLALGPGASRRPAAGAGWRLGDMALVGEALFADFEAVESDIEARWWRAAVLADLGALKESQFLFTKVAAAELPAWRPLAHIHAAVLGGDAKAALSAAEETRGFEPTPPYSATALGSALIRVGEPERAYAALLKRWPILANGSARDIALSDISDGGFFAAARALALAGRRDEARALWQAALANDAGTPAVTWKVHLQRALVHGHLGNREAAIRNFKAAYDAGFRHLWSYDGLERVDDGFYAEHGLYQPLVAIPEIAAMVGKIEAENAASLEAFNKKYGILDKVRAMMTEEAASVGD